MPDSKFWCVVAVTFVVALLYVGNGIVGNGIHSDRTSAFADESIGRDRDAQYVFTASQDGRKIYMWQLNDAKPPKFVGESDAVLSE